MQKNNFCPSCQTIAHPTNPQKMVLNDSKMQTVLKNILIDRRESSALVNPTVLIKELTCPVCLHLYNKTLTASKCLHRFCSECIIKALSINKQCPLCREELISKRSLRPDKEIDTQCIRFPNQGCPKLKWRSKKCYTNEISAQGCIHGLTNDSGE